MIGKVRALVQGKGVKARTARSSFFTILEAGGHHVVRLVSNLILTRLLFPEAFGMIALVQVFTGALQMFSDTGVRVSIMQHAKGDDPEFLNTAWTIQVGRGVLLWLGACALAWPAAAIYDEPMLLQLLPVAGLNAIVAGFQPTKVVTANRHLEIGRVTVFNLALQVLTLVITATLAWLLHSVWALVLGGLAGAVVRQMVLRHMLPGIRNRFHWNPEIGRELFHFGKYIFASTAFGFLINNADRAILGGFISLAELGVYTIGAMFAGLPFSIAQMLSRRIVMPLYRIKPMAESAANQRNIFRVRRLLIGGALAANAALGFAGVFLIDTLYDPRYVAAGPILVLLSLVFVPRIVFVGAGLVLLANGDSRRYLILIGSIATAQTLFLLLGTWQLGIFGAIIAPGLAVLVTSPLRMRYAYLYEAWDAKGEAFFLIAGLVLGGLICWLHLDEIVAVFGRPL